MQTARASPMQACDVFVRGDTSADGAVDFSDAVHVPGYLRLGTPEALCEDAADLDDSAPVESPIPWRC